jgi:SSS family solute:Na+ symporter
VTALIAAAPTGTDPTTALVVTVLYLLALIGVGVASNRTFRGDGEDFYVASHSIGPVMLLLSLFGTTMTSFALVGSTGKAYQVGIGTYGLMASWAAVVHPLMVVVIGVRVWQLGKRFGYVTQVQYLRDRFQSDALGWLLFPILVLLVVPYLMMGIQSAGVAVQQMTLGLFHGADGKPAGVPPWLTGAAVAGVTLTYVFLGGIRAAAWANALQTGIFLVVAAVTLVGIASALGGPEAAIAAAASKRPELLVRGDAFGKGQFLSYALVGLSVGAFPHVFQHWLTASSDRTFKLSAIAHPILVMMVWLPCVLIGVWAAGQLGLPPDKANAVLPAMVRQFSSPWMGGVLAAGIVAAIMSSLDSQYLALGTMFAHDVVLHRHPDVSEARKVALGRGFTVAVAVVSWGLSQLESRSVFEIGVWTFSAFSGLVPMILAALYWRRATAAGAIASVLAVVVTWGGLFLWNEEHGRPGVEPLVLGLMPVTFVCLASVVALVGVSLVTRPPSDQVLARFFPEPARRPETGVAA